MDKIISSQGVTVSKLLEETDGYGMLVITAIQITIFEILKTLGLSCQSRAYYSNGEIADAYAKQKINLAQALQLAYEYDGLQNKGYQKCMKLSNGYSYHQDKSNITQYFEEKMTCLNSGECDQKTEKAVQEFSDIMPYNVSTI